MFQPDRPALSAQPPVDVVVAGAGLAGLTAARELQRSGLRVRVLEAAAHAGGRMRRTRLEWPGGGTWVDLGGQWVGPTQTRMLTLLDQAGLERFSSPHDGETVLRFGGKRCTFSGFFQGFPEGQPPAVPQRDWDDAMAALERFNALAGGLPAAEHPHTTVGAAELDRQSFQDWIDANTHTPFARWYFAYFCRAVGFLGPAEPEQVSLLHVLWGQRSAPQAEHPEEELIHGGVGGLLDHLLADLDEGTLVLNQPVRRILQGHEADADWPVQVESKSASHPCRAVIVAMPPSQAAGIRFSPELPADRQALQAGMAMGRCAKVLIAYASPWWRQRGLSGIAIGDLPTLELCADSSDPRGEAGVLATFVVGHRHAAWSALDAERRRQAVLDDLVAWFGPEAASPLAYLEQDWPRQPFVGGAYAAWMPPGLWSAAGDALRRPHGRVHWAGTETAQRWAGFFDGAVRSGEEAAERVQQLLTAGGVAGAPGHPALDPQLRAIVEAFELSGPVVAIEPLGSGNVNATWRVTLNPSGNGPRTLVLQRLNTQVFPRPDLVMANIRRLGEHLDRPGALAAAAGRWELPRVVPLRGSGSAWLERDGQCWRLLTFIERSRCVDTITGQQQALQVGRALGTFHALIHDLPAEELADTLEGFHITPGYLAQFERVLQRTEVPLTPQAQHCIAFIRDRQAFIPVLEEAQRAGRLRQRPIHGDPKVNNILFDATSSEAIALIDLDTVKPGLVHYDIGDCLRSSCNRLGEETDDWRAVQFDLQLCEAVLEGYISRAHRFLEDADYDHIPDAIRLLSLELGLRFFTDHLAGDIYFRISRPRHNLQRALVQFQLTESIESQLEQIGALVARLRHQAVHA